MPHSRRPRRILVIDDNADAADLLAEVLALYGHATASAHTGRDGLALLDSFRPDLVFLDIGMPELDGYQVAARIRQMPHLPQPQLIAFTAWSDEESKQRALAAGFDLHLTKPADFKVLLDTVLKMPPLAL